jgi:uncharacterized protein YbcI
MSEQAADSTFDGQPPSGGSPRHGVGLTISNAMVKLYKELFGRGPTKARTDWAGPDALVCTLADSFTPAERNLVEMGEHQRLRDVRMFFQYASEHEFVNIVEEIIGRKVTAFISGLDAAKDVSAELFYFEPRV